MKVDKDTAKADVEKWLNAKRFPERKKAKYEEQINELIEMVQYGELVVSEDGKLTYKIQCPSEEADSPTQNIEFKNRISPKAVMLCLQKYKNPNSSHAQIIAHVSAASNLTTGQVEKLDTTDFSAISNIAVFFM